ncbi:MAG: hypothetical protein EOO75_18830 [Myxococcales bacterium]|nr:MAG: hypothetical protein EOO75_18830 [Myxococcales bacterium]
MNDEIKALLDVPAGERHAALEAWQARQSDPSEAAVELARTLAALEAIPYASPGSYTSNEQQHFLDAERLRFALDEAAEACAEDAPAAASQLWCHAGNSALITGDLADLPYSYARRAVRADPTSEPAWGLFTDSIRSYTDDLFGDLESWRAEAARGEVPAELPRRALAAARAASRDWSDAADRERLAGLEV